MKLELKHLAPYLPYELKVETLDYKNDYVNQRYDLLIGFHQWDKNEQYWSCLLQHGSKPDISRVKPILRPLWDLDSLIEAEFKKFADTFAVKNKSEIIDLFCYENIKTEECLADLDLRKLPYECIEYMFKNHYDVFDLIPAGLAVPIHDVG